MFHRHVELYLHIIWSTWGRVAWVEASIRARIHGAIAAVARSERCLPVFVGGTDDHVHVLLRAPPSLCPSVLVGKLKGVSSRTAHDAIGVDLLSDNYIASSATITSPHRGGRDLGG